MSQVSFCLCPSVGSIGMCQHALHRCWGSNSDCHVRMQNILFSEPFTQFESISLFHLEMDHLEVHGNPDPVARFLKHPLHRGPVSIHLPERSHHLWVTRWCHLDSERRKGRSEDPRLPGLKSQLALLASIKTPLGVIISSSAK